MKHSGRKNLGTLIRILQYIKGFRIFFIFSLVFAAASVILTLFIPRLTGDAIDMITGSASDTDRLTRILITIGVMTAINALCQWLMNIANNRITFDVVAKLRHDAFLKIQTLPLSYLDSHPTGDMVNRIISDTDQLCDGLLLGFSQLFTGIMTIVGTLVFMLITGWYIAVIVVTLTPLSLFVASFIAKRTYSMFKEQSEIKAEQTSFADEMLSNRKTAAAFSHEKQAVDGFDEINHRLEKCSRRALFFSSLTNPSTRFVNNIIYAAVAFTGAVFCINYYNGEWSTVFTIGDLSCILSYAGQYMKPFNEISGVVTELQNSLACADRLLELINEPPQTEDLPDARVLSGSEVDGCVNISNVSFSYSPDTELIKDFNLDIKSCQRVAIVGPTGCGKTTFINLLMRFYDVDSGSISVSGTDIRNITRNSLRSAFGMVLQETWLKPGTIRDNITLGKPDATDDEVTAAAKAAHAHSFISRLPNGYMTVIGEDGGSLSQGQKQLLCISRIFLCLPPMLILDEATSSIDTRTEMKIQNAFGKLMDGRTSFIVAHRLSTIREADIILVMNNGKIIESGTHDELMLKKGFYYSLYRSQFDI